MDRKAIVTKTAKGMREASGATRSLARDLKLVLQAVDGRSTPDDLARRLDQLTEPVFEQTLERLTEEGYVREVVPNSQDADQAADLDFTRTPLGFDARQEVESEARRKAEETTRRWAAKREKHRAEERARREAEKLARREAEERAVREADERARLATEESAREMAEAQARRQAEERAAMEAQERAKRIVEKAAKKVAAEQARRDAEERSRCEAEARARREAVESAAREAAEQARREAEARAAIEAVERARREAQARAALEAADSARREAEESARRQADEAARRLAEEVALRQAAESARREAEGAAQRHAEELARREAEDLARREAEMSARRDAEEAARRAAEESARREAEEQAKHQAEELARRDAEEAARRKAEDLAQRETEEQAKREAEEQARRKAAEQAHREAEQQAHRNAARQARRAAQEKALRAVRARIGSAVARYAAWRAEGGARHQASKVRHVPARAAAPESHRRPARRSTTMAYSFLALLAVGLAALHLVSFDSQLARFEKVAAAQFQQPVTIGKVHFSLLLRPHWNLEGVTVGAAGQIRAPRIRLYVDLAALLSDGPMFKAMEADAPRLTPEGLGWLLFGTVRAGLGAAHVEAHRAVLDAEDIGMPPFDAVAEIGADGNWHGAQASFADTDLAVTLEPAKDGVAFSAHSNLLAPPFLPSMLRLTDLSAEGVLDQSGVRMTRFEGRADGGIIIGSAHLRYGERTFEGDVTAKGIDLARAIPGLFEGGLMDGAGSFSLPVGNAGNPHAPRLSGTFVAQRGALAGIDMGSVLKDTGRGGTTRFARLEGEFALADGQARLHQLRLDAGALSARGNAEMAADRSLHGRVDVDFATTLLHRHAVLELSGLFAEPYAKNVGWTRR